MIKLYTIHCQACEILQKKLVSKNIEFEVIDDRDEVVKVGIEHCISNAPMLDVDGNVMDYISAVKWVNNQ